MPVPHFDSSEELLKYIKEHKLLVTRTTISTAAIHAWQPDVERFVKKELKITDPIEAQRHTEAIVKELVIASRKAFAKTLLWNEPPEGVSPKLHYAALSTEVDSVVSGDPEP